MFCGVKIVISDPDLMNRARVLRLSGSSLVDGETGEITTSFAKLRGLDIRSYPGGRNVITGSLHKFANGGIHNADQFTHGRLCSAIEELSRLLGFDPAMAILERLEAGVNLVLKDSPISRLIAYKGRIPNQFSDFEGTGYELRWKVGESILKCYDKARQYGLDAAVFRMEVNAVKMRYFHSHGLHVYTLADLTDPRKVEGFGALLAEVLAELTFADLTDLHRLTNAERRFYERAATFQFWQGITNRKDRYNARARYEAIRAKGGAVERELFTELVYQTWQVLLTNRAQNRDVFTDPRRPENGTLSPFKYMVNSSNSVPTTDLPPRRVCKTCGAGIEHRKPGAVFCEHKRCRNVDSNPRNNFKRRYDRTLDACQLFDPMTVLRLTPEQIRLVAY